MNTKQDKNGIDLRTGQIVKIEGGFFKRDNGLFVIKHSPNDPQWGGNDYCIYKCNKKGIESKSKYATAFYPLMVTVNSREQYLLAKEHNKINVTIEVVGEVNVREVIYEVDMWGRVEKRTTIINDNELAELEQGKYVKVLEVKPLYKGVC
jgi:hypothetical protein